MLNIVNFVRKSVNLYGHCTMPFIKYLKSHKKKLLFAIKLKFSYVFVGDFFVVNFSDLNVLYLEPT